MTDLTKILNGPWSVEPKRTDPPEMQLIDAIESAGIEPPDHVVLDGRMHRFGRKKSAWYIAYPDGVPAGRFGCWREGLDHKWRADVARELTHAEQAGIARRMLEAKRERDKEAEKRHEVAAETVETIWDAAGDAESSHPYLLAKGVDNHGLKITGDGRLMVPVYTEGGLSSIQYISADGTKRFHSGGKMGGGCFTMMNGVSDTHYICEGYATAATILESMGGSVTVAFSAQNIPAVTKLVRDAGAKSIVIVADNDESGVGKRFADEAAHKYGARVVLPPVVGMDVNDWVMAGNDLTDLMAPNTSEWLIPASEYTKQPAPINWLIKGWVQRESLMMIHGPSGGGKTFIALDMALHIAAGMDWQGCKVRQGPVVYLAGEGHHGLRGRIAAWANAHPEADLSHFWISQSGCDLNTPEGYAMAADAIRQLGEPPVLVQVDTLHRFLNGDENSAQDAKTMLDACGGLISEFRTAVQLVHHTGVSDEAQHRARGSSAWRGALDIELSVIPAKGERPIELVQRKSKDAELAKPLHFTLESQEIEGWLDEDGQQVTSAIVQSANPPSRQVDDKLRSAKDIFEKMWALSGKETYCGAPYVTASFAKDSFLEMGHKASTANQYAMGKNDRGPLGALKVAGMLKKDTTGWVVEDSAWGILMNEKAKERL